MVYIVIYLIYFLKYQIRFEVIHKLWQRRTSLETIQTIANLNNICIESEFYQYK